MRGIEGLPLRYIIIVLVAALIVGIALQFVGTLKVGILGGAEKLQTEVSGSIEKSLDQTGPVVQMAWVCNEKVDTLEDLSNQSLCVNVSEMYGEKVNITSELGLSCSNDVYFYTNVTDEGGAGINPYTGVFIYFNDDSKTLALWKDNIFGPAVFNVTDESKIGIYAKDENGNSQQRYILFNVTCT